MYPRKPLPHAEQIVRMARYLRRSRTELRHRYDEFFEATKGRRDCPLEVSIRRRAIDSASDTVALVEAALVELRRQEAMFYAPFKPGDRVLFDREDKGVTQTYGPYLIIDVCPDKRRGYHYETAQLTKSGAIYKRRSYGWLSPGPSVTIRPSECPVGEEGEWESRYYRECAETSRELAFVKGDLTLFEAREGGFLSSRSYRRKDRMKA